LNDTVVDERILLEQIIKKLGMSVDWIQLAQKRSQWWAVVNPLVPSLQEISWPTE
jgi:hypothetical protein